MRPDLLSQRGPTRRSTSACAHGLPQPRRSSGSWLPDPLVAGSQPTLWGHASRVPGRGCRGDAVLPFEPLAKVGADLGPEHLLALPSAMLSPHPPARPATHCPARPAHRRGVTAPPSTALTNGGESLGATLCGSPAGAWRWASPAPSIPWKPALGRSSREGLAPPPPRVGACWRSDHRPADWPATSSPPTIIVSASSKLDNLSVPLANRGGPLGRQRINWVDDRLLRPPAGLGLSML